jgi:hypothetical protein
MVAYCKFICQKEIIAKEKPHYLFFITFDTGLAIDYRDRHNEKVEFIKSCEQQLNGDSRTNLDQSGRRQYHTAIIYNQQGNDSRAVQHVHDWRITVRRAEGCVDQVSL